MKICTPWALRLLIQQMQEVIALIEGFEQSLQLLDAGEFTQPHEVGFPGDDIIHFLRAHIGHVNSCCATVMASSMIWFMCSRVSRICRRIS